MVYNKRNKNCPKDTVYVGRPSIFGNPFFLKNESERIEIVQKYKSYLYARLRMDKSFKAKVKALYGKDLVCWCAPKACHADVLEKAAEELNK